MNNQTRYPFFLLLILLLSGSLLQAQEPARKPGAVKTAEKASKKSADLQATSNQVLNESQQAAANVQQTVNNAKSVIKVFEPILKFRLRKKSTEATTATDAGSATSTDSQSSGNVQADSQATVPADGVTGYDNQGVTFADIQQGNVIGESTSYNMDGSANLGSQNNKTYGCYLDVVHGQVMDEIDAAGNSRSVDLVFTATSAFNEQVPMYAFLTPAYIKNDGAAYNFFKGVKYKDRDIPPASWTEVNESEVAMTALTAAQFDKVRDNNQLMAVVKQVKGFGQKVESRTRLDGKVLAVKTLMGDRTAYGLIYIVNHYGTTGESGYLKIRIKVTGFDGNGDGMPDANLY